MDNLEQTILNESSPKAINPNEAFLKNSELFNELLEKTNSSEWRLPKAQLPESTWLDGILEKISDLLSRLFPSQIDVAPDSLWIKGLKWTSENFKLIFFLVVLLLIAILLYRWSQHRKIEKPKTSPDQTSLVTEFNWANEILKLQNEENYSLAARLSWLYFLQNTRKSLSLTPQDHGIGDPYQVYSLMFNSPRLNHDQQKEYFLAFSSWLKKQET